MRFMNSCSLADTDSPFHVSRPSASAERVGTPTCSMQKLAATLPHADASIRGLLRASATLEL